MLYVVCIFHEDDDEEEKEGNLVAYKIRDIGRQNRNNYFNNFSRFIFSTLELIITRQWNHFTLHFLFYLKNNVQIFVQNYFYTEMLIWNLLFHVLTIGKKRKCYDIHTFALNVWCKVDNVGENLRKNSCNNHFLLIWTSFYLFCIPFIFFLYLLLLCCDLYKNYVTIFEMHVIQTWMRSNVVSVQYPYTCQQQWAYLLNSTACVNEKTMYGVF